MRNTSDEIRLHSELSVFQVMEHQRRTFQEEIMGLTENRLKSSSFDELVSGLADKYSINIPVLDDSNLSPAKCEVDIDMTRSPQHAFIGGPPAVKGTEITISVPYAGDKKVFRMHAGSHTMDYPLARISPTAVTFSLRGVDLDPAQVRRSFDAWISRIQEHLQNLRRDFRGFNESIKGEIEAAINVRLEKLRKDDDLLGNLGFGIPRRSI